MISRANTASSAAVTPSSPEADEVVVVNPLVDPIYQRLVESFDSDVFHSPAWMSVLADTYGFEPRAVVLLDREGEPAAGMPFVRVSDFVGDRIASLPFCDYTDPLVVDRYQWNRLVETLMAEHLPIATRVLHNDVPLLDSRFTVVTRAKWHGLDLTPDLDTLLRGFDESARRAIRKAEREGVEVRPAQSEAEVRQFFDLHLGIRKHKYHLLAQPYRFFQAIWERIVRDGNGALMLARRGEELLGGVMFLQWKDALYYKFNASDPRYLALRPNDIVIWTGIKLAKERGLSRFDFGLSDWDQVELARYKLKYASAEKTITFLRFLPDCEPSSREKEGRKLLYAISSLLSEESVPDDISDRAGDLLYRYFA